MTSQELHRGTTYLVKSAGALGRIANMFSMPAQATLDNPYRGIAGRALPVPVLDEMVGRRLTMGGGEENIKTNIEAQQTGMKERGLGGNISHGARQMAGPGALIGGLAGGVMGYSAGLGHEGNPLASMLLGGGAGALGGALGGGARGAIGGGVNKLLQENTSKDSQNRAKQMLAKHPYLTSVPLLGNVVGGALA